MEEGFTKSEKRAIARFIERHLGRDLNHYLNSFDKEGKITIRIEIVRKNKPVENLDPRSNKKIKIYK
jgi:hypothetical protein